MTQPRPPVRVAPLIALALTFATSLCAADALELARLRAAYDVAVGNAARPVIQEHIASLGKLRDACLRSSKIDDANKVQAEIDRATASMTTGELALPATNSNAGELPDLEKLRTAHAAAMERTLKPLRDTYVRELEKLRAFYARSANLDGANAAQTELTAIKTADAGGSAASKPGATGSSAEGQQPRLSGKAPKSEWYLGKAWCEIKGPGPTWVFAKGGKGEVRYSTGGTAPMTWDVLPNGLLKLQHAPSTGSGVTSIYMHISSATEGICGIGTEKLTRPLRLTQ